MKRLKVLGRLPLGSMVAAAVLYVMALVAPAQAESVIMTPSCAQVRVSPQHERLSSVYSAAHGRYTVSDAHSVRALLSRGWIAMLPAVTRSATTGTITQTCRKAACSPLVR
jgi:hypothetical protein